MTSRIRLQIVTVLMLGLTTFFTGSATCADDQLRAVQRQFTDTIQPILQATCSDCHTGDDASAGFNLDNFENLGQILAARKKWQKVEHRVAAKEMPPPDDAEPLADEDYKLVMGWLDELLHSVDCTNINPGRVTLRRLNRTEYQNTIRDLVGIEYEPAADFPGDDVGYGFDNIADVISLPPILMEKYLSAAEEITARALIDPANPGFNKILNHSELTAGEGAQLESSVGLNTNGTISANITLPADGKYKVIVNAYETHGGDESAKISVGFSTGKSVPKTVSADQDQVAAIPCRLRAKAGNNRLDITFLNDAYQPAADGNPGYDRNLYVQQVQVIGPFGRLPASHKAILEPAGPVSKRKSADPQVEQQLARKILNHFASKAFRRRATSAELDALVEFFQSARSDGDCFEVALRLPLQVVLVSPHFLYKIESPVAAGEIRYLNDFELATSLSYFIWSTMPDQELLQIAGQGKLRNAGVLRQQLDRMLADPKASALVENFVAQWLQLRHLADVKPDPDLFPGVDAQLRADMATETKMVLAEMIRRNEPVTHLLESEFTFINRRLADFYGIKNDEISGERFVKVSTNESGRTGLLTHASILTLTSNPTRTSPVKRGKWIMENLLGEEPPPPDPKAMPLDEQTELTGTNRQRLEQHRADPNCAVCHKVMDELGFALENYDAVGRWRETDAGQPIDATGILPDGSQFSGAKEMQRTIQENMQAKFVRCLTEKMLIYATGRGLEYFDECAIDKILEAMKTHDNRFSELIYLVVTSDPFLKRHGEED